jgi:hypothetical protein
MMPICKHPNSIFLELSYTPITQRLVNLPEVLVVVPLQPLNHPLLVLLLHGEDLVRAACPQVLRLLQTVDVVKTQEVKAFELQALLFLVSLVVEGQAPWEVFVFMLDSH